MLAALVWAGMQALARISVTSPSSVPPPLPGCWVDDRAHRQLPHAVCPFAGCCSLSRELCGRRCGAAGFPLAGVEAGHQCLCGPALTNVSATAPAPECGARACTGAAGEACGGDLRLWVFNSSWLGPPPPLPPPSPPPPVPVAQREVMLWVYFHNTSWDGHSGPAFWDAYMANFTAWMQPNVTAVSLCMYEVRAWSAQSIRFSAPRSCNFPPPLLKLLPAVPLRSRQTAPSCYRAGRVSPPGRSVGTKRPGACRGSGRRG
jgi:hypothetical protein